MFLIQNKAFITKNIKFIGKKLKPLVEIWTFRSKILVLMAKN